MIRPSAAEALATPLAAAGWKGRLSAYAAAVERVQSAASGPEPAVSVIVISWQPNEDALATLESLAAQRSALAEQGRSMEVVFVDNGSTNGFAARLEPLADTFVRLSSNTGAYFARNVGSVFARAPLFLFLEDDGLPEPDLVAAHLGEHERFDLLLARGVYRPRTDSPLNRFAGHYFLGETPFPRYCDLEGNASVQARAFREVGGWDEAIFFGHGGVELSCRLLERYGQPERLIYTPAPVLHHDYSKSEEHLAAKRERQAKSRLYVVSRHPRLDDILTAWNNEYKQRPIPLRRPAADDRETTP